jgi:hypothetical protein
MNPINPMNPYQFGNPFMQPFLYQPQRPTMPQQQVVTVAGADSLSQIQLAPNSSMLVMDQGAPIVYLVQSDGVGKVTATSYDIAPHKDAAAVQRESMDARLSALEAAVKRLEGQHEPDAHEPV